MLSDEIRASLERYLETDLALGVDFAPLRPPARSAAPAAGAIRRTSARQQTVGAAQILATQPISPEELIIRRESLERLGKERVGVCTRCGLSKTRHKVVFGQGNPAARLVFVGEAPGADEDAQGLAFVGRAGQLLTRMIAAMGLTRDQVFICNILKCRPPNNREPAPDEISACWPHLDEQLRIIRPEVIVALGKPAAQTLLRTSAGIGELRGRWHDYYVSGSPLIGPPTPLMPTYHPAYLLRSPGEKRKAWNDLQLVMARLGLPMPA